MKLTRWLFTVALMCAMGACAARPTAEEIRAETMRETMSELVDRYAEAQDARVREAQAATVVVASVAVLALVAVIVIGGASAVVMLRGPRAIERPLRLITPPGETRVLTPRRIGQEVER